MLITDNPDVEEDEPEFKYVAAIHGDESLSSEMYLYFIDLLLTEYGTDERITNLVDSHTIETMSMNRTHQFLVDLDTIFPKMLEIFSSKLVKSIGLVT
jgi:hypothetical protein